MAHLRLRQRILVVDDDFDEQFLFNRALSKVLDEGSTVNLANSGDEAISYMIGEGKYADRKTYPFPTTVLSDLNMNPGDGFDVLEFMAANPAWNVVPRVIVSTSDDDDDVRTAFYLGASAYHLKPIQPIELESLIHFLMGYWSRSIAAPVDENGKLRETRCKGRLGERYPQIFCDGPMVRPDPRDESESSEPSKKLSSDARRNGNSE